MLGVLTAGLANPVTTLVAQQFLDQLIDRREGDELVGELAVVLVADPRNFDRLAVELEGDAPLALFDCDLDAARDVAAMCSPFGATASASLVLAPPLLFSALSLEQLNTCNEKYLSFERSVPQISSRRAASRARRRPGPGGAACRG